MKTSDIETIKFIIIFFLFNRNSVNPFINFRDKIAITTEYTNTENDTLIMLAWFICWLVKDGKIDVVERGESEERFGVELFTVAQKYGGFGVL